MQVKWVEAMLHRQCLVIGSLALREQFTHRWGPSTALPLLIMACYRFSKALGVLMPTEGGEPVLH